VVDVGESEDVKLSYEIAVYKEQLTILQSEIERVTLTMLDLDNALRTLENLQINDALVQIGGGVFVKANIYSTRALVPIGAGYLVEMEKDLAILELKKRLESTKKAVEKLREEFQKISLKLREADAKIRNLQSAAAILKRTEENEHAEYV
jgi:prefoldin alpha subunit